MHVIEAVVPVLVLLALFLALLLPTPSRAIDDIAAEEDIADLITTPPPEPEKGVAGRQWAVLPLFGYSPDGAEFGVKYEHRNLVGSGFTLDVEASWATRQQRSLKLSIGSPHLMGDRFLILLRARYRLHPQIEFFGLGNNNVGPDPASTYLLEEYRTALTAGWRPHRTLALNAGVGVRHVRIGVGDRKDDFPFTVDRFRGMAGLEGGFVNPLELSAVWNTREEVIRPTRGWRGILKVSHTNRDLQSDFEYTRGVGDLSYLYSFANGAHIIGARIGGAYIDGPARRVPFWELEMLGGDDTLRGFFPRRFSGKARVLASLEYRFKLVDFDFFSWWHVYLDGVAFGEVGRVWQSRHSLIHEFGVTSRQIPLDDDMKSSFGPGLRIALSRALVARIDVGFSEEETAEVYLAFGHTF